MADQQITQLPEETGTVASTFPLAIVNVTAAETRKITTANLATAIFSNLGIGGLAASKVAAGYSGASLTDGTVTNAKLVNSSVNFGGVSVALGAQDLTPSFNLQDATGYPCSALTGTITNAQLAGSIAVSKLASSAVSFGGISVSLGASDATPAFDLTDATNYPTSSLTGTITNAQLGGSIANAKLVNSSVSFGGISVALGASDATPAFDLQDATGYKTTNLVGTITNSQLAGSIDASKLVANSLTTDQLGPNCVGASELANNAVDSGAVASGAITNDKIETSSSSTTGIDGATKLRAGSVPASKIDASTVGNGLAINSNVLSINNSISGATSLGLTFSNQGICTGIAALQASDLSGVLATASAVGVVKVPSSGGLSVSGSGDLSLATTITAFNTRGINVNAFGQVTSVSATVPSASLPVASTTAVGGVKIPSTSSPLTVDGNGVLTIGVSGVTAGTGFTKFNVNDKGLITSAGAITAAEIPPHSATLLTSGTVDAGRIGSNTISGAKLSDSSTTVFGGPGSTSNITTFPSAGDFKGQRFWDEYNSDEYIWTGSSWTPVTITAGELVFLGLYSASDNTVSSVTTSGAAAGLTANNALPSASNTNKRGYVVVDDTGTGSGNAPAVTLNAPDYLLSDGTAWKHVDVSSAIAATSANQVSVSATGDDITNNVQASLENLQTNKIRKTGGEMSGLLRITSTGSLAFEGSSEDAFETFLSTVNPTDADKTILLPNISGTLITTGDTNTVTSTMVDASLANANLAANAAIALSKLAPVSAGQILVGAASTGTITGVTPSGDIALTSAGAFSYVAGSIVNADINASAGISASKIDAASTSQAGCVQLSSATTSTSATKAATSAAVKIAKDAADAAQSTADAAFTSTGGVLTGNITLDNQKEVRFREADAGGDHYIALKAAAALAGDVTLTLPNNSPSAGFVLKAGSSTATDLEWADPSDANKLSLSGGTMAGAINMGANNITNGGTITGTFVGDITGNASGTAATVTAAAQSAITSLGTLTSLGVAGNLTVDTNTLHVDATNNRVGIGTTSPNSLLNIHGVFETNAFDDANGQGGRVTTGGLLIGDAYTAGKTTNDDRNAIIWNERGLGIVFGTNNVERMQIDSSGRLLVGTNATTGANFGSTPLAIFESSTTNDYGRLGLIYNGADQHASAITFGKSRGTSDGSNTVVQADDQIGSLFFQGADGTDKESRAAAIMAFVDGTPGSNDMPGRLTFLTTADGAASPTERMRITNAGKIGINIASNTTGDLQVCAPGTAHGLLRVGGNANSNVGLDINYSNSGNTSTIFKQNYVANNAGALMQFDAGYFVWRTGTGLTTALTINASQNATFAGTVSDSLGNLRSIPYSSNSGAYTLVAADAGKVKGGDTSWTIPASTFSAGDTVTLLNLGSSDLGITASALTYLWNTADAANIKASTITLGGRGIATIYFKSANEAFIQASKLNVS